MGTVGRLVRMVSTVMSVIAGIAAVRAALQRRSPKQAGIWFKGLRQRMM